MNSRLLEIIDRFVNAQTWTESQEVVKQHPELLTEEADRVLAQLMEVQDREEARQVLQEHRELLQQCRQVGIERAFQEKTGGSAAARIQQAFEDVPPELRGLIQEVVGELLASGVQISSPEDLEQFLRGRPGLQQRIESGARVSANTSLPNWISANPLPENSQGYWQVLQALLQAEATGGEQAVNRVIAQHRQQFDARLIRVLQQWAEATLREQVDRPDVCEEVAGLLGNIGIRILEFPLGTRPGDVQVSIACFEITLRVCQQAQNLPKQAQTLSNLGNAYLTQAQLGIDPAQNLQRAIASYSEAAEILRRLGLERDLSSTLNNLGIAYLTQAQLGIDPEASRQRAIGCYREALQYFNPQILPVETLKATRSLGNLHFTQGNWQLALDEGYKIAIQAVEQTRTWASSDDRRQEVLENAIGVYDNALQCYINLQQYSEAILLSERVRSRHLVDLMHSNDLYQGGEMPTEIQQYLEEYEALQQQVDCLRQQQRPDGSTLSGTRLRLTLPIQETLERTVEALIQRKEEIWRKLRAKDPVLAEQLEVPQLDFDQLAALIADRLTSAILSFYSTNDHTYIFIVRHGETRITCDVHPCLDQGYRELQNWIRNQWLVPYKVDFDTWIQQMPQHLHDMAQKLQLDRLIAEHLQGIEELILIPHIFLHLIPFAALPVHLPNDFQRRGGIQSSEGYLSDFFRLRVVPSAQILKYCHDREQSPQAPPVPGQAFGSVEDATGARPIVASGFEPIAQRLQIPENQRLRGPQQATLTNYRELTRNSHVRALHSIHHAGSDLEKPLESALLLANHERLTLGQLMSPGWRMPHLTEVFLSCCETNLGRPNVTDDIVTLSTGFLCAGARVVISTLWSVDALATALFCDFYYQFRQTGSDRPTALQQAQQALRQPGRRLGKAINGYFQQAIAQSPSKVLKETLKKQQEYYQARIRESPDNPLFDNPYYWAGFVSQGLC